MPRRGENIYHRKDGRWEGRYPIGNITGRTKYRSIYGNSYSDVKTRLSELRSKPVLSAVSCKSTVAALFQEWLSAIKNSVKPSTLENYRMKIEKHLIPEFGDIRYDRLTVNQIQSFIDRKLEGGLSAKYVSDIVTVFKSMAKYMNRVHKYANPLTNLIMPKIEKREMNLFSFSQQKELTRYLLNHMNLVSVGILLSLFCGLRLGEVCGLMWSDIDLQSGRLSINRTAQRMRCQNGNNRTVLHIGTPKSRSSKRTIPLPSFLMKILRQFQNDDKIYVVSGTAQPLDPRTMQNRFHAVLKKANLPSVNYHSLRHIFATNGIAAGFDVKTLSEILGHSSVETTLNRYVHSSMDRKAACMELLKAHLPSDFSSDKNEKAA